LKSPIPVPCPLIPEVLVIDNASTDGSAAMVRERFPGVRLIENAGNAGFARANNQGLALATGRYVLLLNPHGSLQPACHPMLTPGREFWRLLFLERLRPRVTYPMGRWDIVTPRRVEVIKGACLLLRRAALDQVGVLDDSYFMYTEEVDLCYRLAQAGWELWYVPTAVVTHYGEASSRQVREEMYVQLYRSKIQFYRKFGGERRARYAKTLLALAYAPRWLAAALGSPLAASPRRQASTFRRLLSKLPEM
jgi:N-acetylglucosaminyl-diphospho-decaprenol L-rhamnosyltransferase